MIGIFFLNLVYFLTISAAKLFLLSSDIGKTITFAFFIASTAAIVKSDGSPGPTPTMVNVGKSVLYGLSKLKNFFIIIFVLLTLAMYPWQYKSFSQYC